MIGYTIVGGFLGSGKTTMINAMLATATERLAVIVNDIGDVNIDAALLAPTEGSDQPRDTIELTNGCVCCSVGDSLASTLRTLCTADRPPDRIVLECSGAADPGRAARYGSRRILTEPTIIVAIDATDVRRRAEDPRFSGLINAQLDSADQLVVTKSDLVDETSLAGTTGWLTTRSSAVLTVGHPEALGVVASDIGRRSEPEAIDSTPPLQVETIRPEGPITAEWIDAQLAAIDGLVRAKGIVETDDGLKLVQWAAGRLSVEEWAGPKTTTGIVTIS